MVHEVHPVRQCCILGSCQPGSCAMMSWGVSVLSILAGPHLRPMFLISMSWKEQKIYSKCFSLSLKWSNWLEQTNINKSMLNMQICGFFLFFFFRLFFSSALCFLVPHEQSLRWYRVEANWALRHFSEALTDLDYLCGLRPNWTEVRHVQSWQNRSCHISFAGILPIQSP